MNFTAVDLGYSAPRPWTLDPLAYQSTPCFSEGPGPHPTFFEIHKTHTFLHRSNSTSSEK